MSIARISWHGWSGCYSIANGMVEAVIVPAIGRVMGLRLLGDTAGAFWENRELDGRLHSPSGHPAPPDGWLNFGGDKCWPAPQTAWPRQQGRAWPPPAAFDSLPMEAISTQRTVMMTSQVDPAFGLQVLRHIELEVERPVMRIRTEFRKLYGNPVTVAIWTVTQMQEPGCICMLLPARSIFPRGHLKLLDAEPADLKIDGRLLSLVRHPSEYVKIGSDAASLAWVGSTCIVRIDAEPEPGEYPDGGCVTEVYTNPGPLPYVEMETLGRLTTMAAGDRIERTTIYAVLPRTTVNPQSEARNAFRTHHPLL